MCSLKIVKTLLSMLFTSGFLELLHNMKPLILFWGFIDGCFGFSGRGAVAEVGNIQGVFICFVLEAYITCLSLDLLVSD